MGRFTGVFGLLALLFIAWLLSNNRRRFPWRVVIWGLVLQFGFAVLVLKSPFGYDVFRWLDGAFQTLIGFSVKGSEFVWKSYGSGKIEKPLECFVVLVLPTIIFFSTLMTVLYHLGVMQLIVKAIAWVMRRSMGTSGAETLSCSANIFVGQTEGPLMVRPFIQRMTKSELMTVMTGGFATVAGGVMALYVMWLRDSVPDIAGHLMAASIMSAPAAILVAKIMYPETQRSVTAGDVKIRIEKIDDNVVEALARGATDGMKLAINVAAMLIAFVAMVELVNFLLGLIGTSLEEILATLFRPLAFLMGAPWSDSKALGQLLGEKIVLTELIAYSHLADADKTQAFFTNLYTPIAELTGSSGITLADMGRLQGEWVEQEVFARYGWGLSERTRIIASYALCGFANFASVGIQLGGIGGMAPDRRKDLAKIGLKALAGGAIASWTTACVAGLLL
jgi:CNT family concentrative nucleoside transporter